MEVKIIRNDIIKKIIAFLLIVVLTMVDFALLGVEAVSYAVDAFSIDTPTNNKNVTFDCYFKDQNGTMITSKEENISNGDMKLFAQVSVKNEGYFNGTVTINEGNFKLKSYIHNNNINKIEGNVITLNQINSGETVELELGIEAVKEDTISSGLLNMNTNISIDGIYRNSEERDIKIETKREVNLILTSPYAENEGAEITSEILTNKVYKVNGENKRVVQLLVESGLRNNGYPIKENNIEVSVPEGVEKVEVRARGMLNSNGKEETEFNNSNWNYIESEHKVNISIKNNEENGAIKWNKEGKDSIVVTYIMAEEANAVGTEITSKSKITLYDTKVTIIEASATSKVLEEKDGAITTGIDIEEASIYKGKIYSGENREYKVKTRVYVNKANTGKTANLDLNPSTYEVLGGELESNIQYVNTTVKKAEVERILGETGKLTITTENGVQTTVISKDTETDENGNIVLTYAEGTMGIKVETTEAKQEGTINLIHTKVIKEEGRTREEKRAYTGIKEKLTGIESKIELRETETKAELNINKTRLTTLGVNENVEITATMKTNSEKYELFKNPTFEIELPEGIKNINLKTVQPVYAEMFKINEEPRVLDNRTIIVSLEGEQTSYTNGLNETTIAIMADIEFDRLTPSNKSAVIMNYVNGTASFSERKEIQIESKYGLMMYTTMEGFNNSQDKIETMDDEVAKGSLDIDASSKETTVKTTTINNYDEIMENVSIIGRIPTEGMNDGTINTELIESKASIEGVQILYSKDVNAKATDNTWTDSIAGAKAYKINVGRLDKGARIDTEYTFRIPENIGYGQSIYAKVDTDYTYLGNSMEQTSKVGAETSKLTGINTSTLKEAIVTNNAKGITANIGTTTAGKELKDGDSVYEGQAIEYTVQLTNNTGKDLKNVNISVEQENGTMYGLKDIEVFNEALYGDDKYHIEHAYRELDTNSKDLSTVDNFENGKTIRFVYQIIVNKIQDMGNTQGKIVLKADDTDEVSFSTITNKIEHAELKLSYRYATNEEVKLYSGQEAKTYLDIENTSDRELKDIKVKVSLPSGTYAGENFYLVNKADETNENIIDDSRIANIKYNEQENTITFDITELKTGNKVGINLFINVNEFEQETKDLAFIAEATTKTDKIYYSNVVSKTIYNIEKNIIINQQSDIDQNAILQDGEQVNLNITVKNNSNKNIGLSMIDKIPDSFIIKDIKIEGLSNTEQNLEEIAKAENIIHINDTLDANGQIKIALDLQVNAYGTESVAKNTVQIDYGEIGEDGYSIYSQKIENEKLFNISTVKESNTIEYVQVDQTSNIENKSTINNGQEIIYIANIKNISKNDVDISVRDVLPTGITATRILVDNNDETNNLLIDNSLVLNNYTLETGKEKQIKIFANYNEDNSVQPELTNIVSVDTPENTVSSNAITYYTDIDSNTSGNSDNEENNGNNSSNASDIRYKISGLAWLDENKNGQRESSEKLLSGIEVKVIDTESGNFVQENGNDISTTTSENGEYSFNLQRGNYIVIFMYDSNKYVVTQYQKTGISNTQNSDVIGRTIEVNGNSIEVASTDNIKLITEDQNNIDMGLLENTKFDFELKKYISEVTVKTVKGVNKYNYNDTELAKIEIHAKELNNANVIIKYTIRVKNNGEIAGYVKDITDYMPSSLTFNSEMNTDWYQTDKNLHSSTLQNTRIGAGETKDITLILTKNMTENNTGLISNLAELTDVNNELGAKDLDSTPGNKTQGEDDMGKADVIVSVKTGALVMYVGLVIAMLIVIGLGAYIINRKLLKNEPKEIDF